MSEKEFVEGLFVKAPHANAPDFVKASISINLPVFLPWLEKQTGPWVKIDTNESRAGNWYSVVNTFVPKASNDESHTPKKTELTGNEVYEDVPF